MKPQAPIYDVSFFLYAGTECVKKFVMGLTMEEIEQNRILDPAARLKFARDILTGAGHSDGGATACWFSLRGGKA